MFICIALYYALLIYKVLRYDTCKHGITVLPVTHVYPRFLFALLAWTFALASAGSVSRSVTG